MQGRGTAACRHVQGPGNGALLASAVGRRSPANDSRMLAWIAPDRLHGNAPTWLIGLSISVGVIGLFKPASAGGSAESDVYLEDVAEAPACDGAPRAGMCRHTSFGFGKNAR